MRFYNKIIIAITLVMLLSACDFITYRRFVLSYDRATAPPNKVVSVIKEYFDNIGFVLLQERHAVHPHDVKENRYGVGHAYKIFNFMRGAETITVLLVEDKDIFLEWDQFGPKFEPKPEYFDEFISLIKNELKEKLGIDASITLIPGAWFDDEYK